MQSSIDIKTLVREGYNSIHSDYAATRSFSWPSGKCIESWLQDNIKSNMTILDVGCGAGHLVEVLHQTGKTVEYIGVDLSSGLLAEAKKFFGSQYNNVSCQWLEGDMDYLEFADESFDIICVIASIHHLPSSRARMKVVHKLYSLLKPSGYICGANWYTWSRVYWKKFDLYKQAMLHPWRVFVKGDIFITWKNKHGEVLMDRYIHSFHKNEFRNMLKKAGFQIIKNKFYSKNKRPSIATAICTIGRKS